MKNKRIVALVLIVTMLLVSACGGTEKSDKASESATSTEASTTSGTENKDAATDETAVVDEEPYTVAIQVITLPGSEFEGQEEREAAINAITLPAINCTVDIQEVWISELNQKTSMAAAGNEKLDILHVGTVSPLSSMVGSEILIDMNEDNLVQEHGQALIALFGEDLLASGEVSGKQLAVPAKVFNASAKGFYYNKTLADQYGVNVPETISSLDELTAILEEVKSKVPDIMPFYSGDGKLNYLGWLASYSSFGTASAYGAILDEEKNLTVENLFTSELYKEFALTMYDWTAKGLQSGDPTDTSLAQDYFKSGKLFCVVSDINETIKADIGSGNPEITVGWTQMVEPKITNAGVTEYMWGIASNSERPDKAMDFLNLLYSNADIANILYFGIQGTNYTLADGTSNIAIINGSYLPIFFRGGDQTKMYIKAPAGADYIEKSTAMESQASVSPILGYIFDDSEYLTESAVLSSTINEFLPQLSNGMGGSEEGTLALLDKFNKQLEASGINDVINANQEQLDAFMSGK